MKPLLIVNPHAAGRRAGRRWSETAALVRQALGPFDAVFTAYGGHAEELAADAASSGRELVVAVGGDGTLSDVVNGILGDRPPTVAGVIGSKGRDESRNGPLSDVTVGLIVQGTGGDFRRSLGWGRGLRGSLEALADGRERLVDIGALEYTEADGATRRRYFLNIVSAGMGGLVDRYVAASPPWLGGRLSYYGATLRALLTVPLVTLSCTLALDGETIALDLPSRVVAVCNGAYFGSGMRMAPTAAVDDDRLEVVSIGTRTRTELAVRSRSVYRGRHLRYSSVRHYSCQRIEMRLGGDGVEAGRFPLDVDGEPKGFLPLTARVVPRALRIRG